MSFNSVDNEIKGMPYYMIIKQATGPTWTFPGKHIEQMENMQK